ncbi:hypothetical protein HELRODRAFT_174003 [Helobdella robusta]|uniref:Uncharacterized protein n=1 Tax=Helobdella robusta TaxID=6412 RepID=T1F7G8_HELRO|nr:hypothetical protein HELRODRAFT_174003 [Helobdella robusta]ESO03115.1 hypothetical protein HELRODRAFT_174003 [Helobdella robusta]
MTNKKEMQSCLAANNKHPLLKPVLMKYWMAWNKIEEIPSDEQNKTEIRNNVNEMAVANNEVKTCPTPDGKHFLALRVYAFVCRATLEDDQKKMSEEEEMKVYKEMTNINEDPFWPCVRDVIALILRAILCFLIGFFQ